MAGDLVRDRIMRVLPALLMLMIGAFWLASARTYLPHVDDFFMVTWAKAIAEGASFPVDALARSYPLAELFTLTPRLHSLVLATHFRAFGVSLESLLLFRAMLFLLSAGLVAIVAWQRRLNLVLVFFPALLCLSMLHTGLRPEGTALVFLFGGLALLMSSPASDAWPDLGRRTIGKTLIVLAPLAAPSALAYGAGLLIASDLRDLGRRRLWRLALEDIIALATGILVLGAMVGFDYAGFLQTYLKASEAITLVKLEPAQLVKGTLLIAAALIAWRTSPDAAFVVGAVGLGTLITLALHNKISISLPLTGLALLVLADLGSQHLRMQSWASAGLVVIFTALFFNQAVFAVASRAAPDAAAAVRSFAQRARAEGRTLLVDEVAAFHGLRLDIGGTKSWTWSMPSPKFRPVSTQDLREGESWIVSAYTIHGWLRSTSVEGFPEESRETARRLPALPCLLGRNSCRLPSVRWGYYLAERRDGLIKVRAVP